VLYGSMRGTSAYRKGADLFQKALETLRNEMPDLQFVVFGQSSPSCSAEDSSHINYLGPLSDEISLMIAYSAADVFVLPSRQDNLPNAALESFACGTPIAAFRTGGLPDIVEHQENGYLATALDSSDLAEGIEPTHKSISPGSGCKKNHSETSGVAE
jgi:glycosyltransferase involved in cell wall biosynthesis